ADRLRRAVLDRPRRLRRGRRLRLGDTHAALRLALRAGPARRRAPRGGGRLPARPTGAAPERPLPGGGDARLRRGRAAADPLRRVALGLAHRRLAGPPAPAAPGGPDLVRRRGRALQLRLRLRPLLLL